MLTFSMASDRVKEKMEVDAPVLKLDIKSLSVNLSCGLCSGYLVDAYTVTECGHSFCRSCLFKYLETASTCSQCGTKIYTTLPMLNIRSDKTLQNLTFTLVPGLYEDEMTKRREFYQKYYESNGYDDSPEQGISVCLRLYSNSPPFPKDSKAIRDKRYLCCPPHLPMELLRKFIRHKFNLKDVDRFEIKLYFGSTEIPDFYIVADVERVFQHKKDSPVEINFVVMDTHFQLQHLLKNHKRKAEKDNDEKNRKRVRRSTSSLKLSANNSTLAKDAKDDSSSQQKNNTSGGTTDSKSPVKPKKLKVKGKSHVADKNVNNNAPSSKVLAVPLFTPKGTPYRPLLSGIKRARGRPPKRKQGIVATQKKKTEFIMSEGQETQGTKQEAVEPVEMSRGTATVPVVDCPVVVRGAEEQQPVTSSLMVDTTHRDVPDPQEDSGIDVSHSGSSVVSDGRREAPRVVGIAARKCPAPVPHTSGCPPPSKKLISEILKFPPKVKPSESCSGENTAARKNPLLLEALGGVRKTPAKNPQISPVTVHQTTVTVPVPATVPVTVPTQPEALGNSVTSSTSDLNPEYGFMFGSTLTKLKSRRQPRKVLDSPADSPPKRRGRPPKTKVGLSPVVDTPNKPMNFLPQRYAYDHMHYPQPYKHHGFQLPNGNQQGRVMAVPTGGKVRHSVGGHYSQGAALHQAQALYHHLPAGYQNGHNPYILQHGKKSPVIVHDNHGQLIPVAQDGSIMTSKYHDGSMMNSKYYYPDELQRRPPPQYPHWSGGHSPLMSMDVRNDHAHLSSPSVSPETTVDGGKDCDKQTGSTGGIRTSPKLNNSPDSKKKRDNLNQIIHSKFVKNGEKPSGKDASPQCGTNGRYAVESPAYANTSHNTYTGEQQTTEAEAQPLDFSMKKK